ncbi:fukutin [Lingula anatina]|uniref:Fukutin n=1 Tax=Lingula anatina TaxID=7574 RepID=A0A1S3HNK2_LINAN|nr:fukutin [Lingula anatina]|eukprot:XP_013387627.1 fukutin [Lingula anatina]
MGMKKSRMISCLLCCSLCFVFMQVILHRLLKPRLDTKMTEEGGSSTEYLSHANIERFLRLCGNASLPVFLFDEYILQQVLASPNNMEIKNRTCKFLCNKQLVTSFAITAEKWLPEHKVHSFIKESVKEGFTSVISLKSEHWNSHLESYSQDPSHYFFKRGGHIIHLVVLYEIMDKSWWHGAIVMDAANEELQEYHSYIHASRVGVFAGLVDKFETVQVKMDSISVNAPRYPKWTLAQMNNSRYIECNHTQAKLFYQKYPLEETERMRTFREQAINLLRKGSAILDGLGVRFWLSSGTCLGWYRQCDIIPHTTDVDFGIWIKDYNKKIVPSFLSHGFSLDHQLGKVSDSFQLSFKYGDVKLDIFFFYEEGEYMWNGATQVKTANKYKYYFPRFTLCWTMFYVEKVRVPCETQSYLEANYGTNWWEPVKIWDWKKSPPNVRENGQWPEEEWDDVIQIPDS